MRLTSLTLAVLATSVAAVPHHRHAHQHPERRDVDVVTTSIVEIQEAVLYVDQNGNPVATSLQPADAAPTDPAVDAAGDGSPWGAPSPYGSGSYPQPMPTPSSQASSSEAPSTPPPQTTQAPPPSSDSAPDTSSAPPPQSAAPESGDDEDVDGDDIDYSIAYAPYNSDHSCKTESEISTDIRKLKNYGMVRIYGTDCDQVRLVMEAAKQNNLKVFLGIWDIANAASEANIIVDAAKNDWSWVHAVSVGNEVVNSTTVHTVVEAIGTARSVLQAGGFNGDVTTVGIWITLRELLGNPSNGLCEAMDVIAANCHPFFDSEVTAEEAGPWVAQQAATLNQNCTRDVIITESGWPSEGPANGKAVPGTENQNTVINGLRAAYADQKDRMVLFSAFNDPWKQDNGYGVESYWGIYGNAPSAR